MEEDPNRPRPVVVYVPEVSIPPSINFFNNMVVEHREYDSRSGNVFCLKVTDYDRKNFKDLVGVDKVYLGYYFK